MVSCLHEMSEFSDVFFIKTKYLTVQVSLDLYGEQPGEVSQTVPFYIVIICYTLHGFYLYLSR